MLPISQAYQDELERLLEEAIVELNKKIINGYGILDYAEYKYNIGKIAGFAYALELSKAAIDLVNTKYR